MDSQCMQILCSAKKHSIVVDIMGPIVWNHELPYKEHMLVPKKRFKWCVLCEKAVIAVD